jgi:hypothetical protein
MSTVPVNGHAHGALPGAHVRLLSVPKEGSCTVRLLGPGQGILTHFTPKRPYACPGADRCQVSIHRASTTWKAYAPAELWRDVPYRDWLPVVLEITERLWESMNATALRGQIWSLWRVGGDRKSQEVTGELLDIVEPQLLRTDVEVVPVVCRVYRTNEIQWGVRPFLPPRQVLTPAVDCPPPNAAKTVDPREIPGTPEYEADQIEARARLKAALAGKQNGKQQRTGGVR